VHNDAGTPNIARVSVTVSRPTWSESEGGSGSHISAWSNTRYDPR